MPDWSYHPLFRPLLFRMAPPRARRLTLGALHYLGRLPGGLTVIDSLGHLRPPLALRQDLDGLELAGPVGLGAGLDIEILALPALARFGFGYIEAGPVTLEAIPETGVVRGQQEIGYASPFANPGMLSYVLRLAHMAPLTIPLGFRLACQPGATASAATDERRQLVAALAPYADFWVLDGRQGLADSAWPAQEWSGHLAALAQATRGKPLLLCLPPDLPAPLLDVALLAVTEHQLAGIVVGGGLVAPGTHLWVSAGRTTGAATLERSLECVRAIRQRQPGVLLIGSGGIHEPAAALRFLAAGANLVQLHSGLVYAGPGLPKRINEAILATQPAAEPALAPRRRWAIPWAAPWIWAALLGASMVLGGILAWLIALTRVVLPYDEAFLGLSRAEINAINARLLPFMAHDRVTLAGTMISIGVIYWQLAVYGLRRQVHWARQALLVSALIGFASFFLFLGFGYFDPLHALVAVLLFPMFVLGIRGRAWEGSGVPCADRSNDRAWRMAAWGQLSFILLGLGLISAGLAIMAIGVGPVFVAEDLAFMRTSAAALRAANAHLVPLIAHDRAGFGGALLSNGLAVLLISLWGFRRGARWLWWTLLIAGVTGFAGAVGVHLQVGYLDLFHLSPAYAAIAMFALALSLSYPYLADRPNR